MHWSYCSLVLRLSHPYLVCKISTIYLPRVWFAVWHAGSNKRDLTSLRPRQNGRLFADDTFKRIFLNENIRISTKNSLKFVPKGLINNFPALVLIMAWRRSGDKPLSEPMLVRSLTHICVTRPQWVNQGVLNIWSKFGDLAWTDDALSFGQTQGGHTNIHTDRRRQRQNPQAETGLG